MKVFSLFESSLKDPNKLNRIFLRIYGIHKKKKLKKKFLKKRVGSYALARAITDFHF